MESRIKFNNIELSEIFQKERKNYSLVVFVLGLAYGLIALYQYQNYPIVKATIHYRLIAATSFILLGVGMRFSDYLYSRWQFFLTLLVIPWVITTGLYTGMYHFEPAKAYINLVGIIAIHLLFLEHKWLRISLLFSFISFIGLLFYCSTPGVNLKEFVALMLISFFMTYLLISNKIDFRKKVNANRKLMNAIFRQSLDPYLIYDVKSSEIIDCNHSSVQLFGGNSRFNILGGDVEHFPFLRFLQQQLGVIKSALNSDRSNVWNSEVITRTFDDREIALDMVVMSLSNNIAEDILFIRLMDITQDRISREGLDLLRQSVNQMPSMFFLLDHEYRIYYANDLARKTLGKLDVVNLKQKFMSNIDMRFPEYYELLEKDLKEKRAVVVKTNYKDYKGKIIPVEVQFSSIIIQDQVFTCVIARDISTQKRIMNIVRETEELSESVFEKGPFGIVIINPKLEITRINQQMMDLLGYSDKSEIKNKSLEKVVFKDDWDLVKQEIETAVELKNGSQLNNGTVNSVFRSQMKEKQFLKKDGNVIWGKLTFSVIKDAEKGLYTIAMLDDVTQRVKSQQILKEYALRLENSNKELEQFAYVVSHDLQEPLRMVSSYLQLLERRAKDGLDQSSKEFINYAVDGSQRMHLLIEGLLQYSRVNTKGNEHTLVDFNDIVHNVLLVLRTRIDEAKAKVTVAELPKLKVDKIQMVQLFQNLVSNALKYNDKERELIIQINATERETFWEFVIKDNGIGIEETYLESIFGVFKRLHTRNEYEGTGIGLAICKRIVEKHEGKIWASSTFGEGANFHFTLPK